MATEEPITNEISKRKDDSAFKTSVGGFSPPPDSRPESYYPQYPPVRYKSYGVPVTMSQHIYMSECTMHMVWIKMGGEEGDMENGVGILLFVFCGLFFPSFFHSCCFALLVCLLNFPPRYLIFRLLLFAVGIPFPSAESILSPFPTLLPTSTTGSVLSPQLLVLKPPSTKTKIRSKSLQEVPYRARLRCYTCSRPT